MTSRSIPAALALATALGAAALGACSSDTPATPSDPVLAQGQDVYNAQCAQCHGVTGGGGVGPAIAGVLEERYPDIAEHIAIVADGVPGSNMPAFKARLSAEEIEAVARYEREVLGG